jgi:hypothetical protein
MYFGRNASDHSQVEEGQSHFIPAWFSSALTDGSRGFPQMQAESLFTPCPAKDLRRACRLYLGLLKIDRELIRNVTITN